MLVSVDAAGNERTAYANTENGSCDSGEMLIDYETLRPLLATLTCLKSGAATSDRDNARPIRADDGCLHGFNAYGSSPPHWLQVIPASAGGVHTLKLSHCEGKATGLQLLDAGAGTVLAESTTSGGASESCPTISHALDPERSYLLKVTAEAVTFGGHVLLEYVTGDAQ
jgi:hypothetical protein